MDMETNAFVKAGVFKYLSVKEHDHKKAVSVIDPMKMKGRHLYAHWISGISDSQLLSATWIFVLVNPVSKPMRPRTLWCVKQL